MTERMHTLLDAVLEAGRRMQTAAADGDAERLARHVAERALVLDALRALPVPPDDDPALAAFRAAFTAQHAPLDAALRDWENRLAETNAEAQRDVQRLRHARRGYDAPPPRARILREGLSG